MRKYYLAVDIGASNGRLILSHYENEKIELEEVHRFENSLVDKNGQLCWDLEKLFSEIKTGLKKCKELDKIPESIGIDTWGVDFVLLDKDNNVLGNTVSYRDKRTKGMDKLVYEKIEETELYKRTGIQKQIFNTIYQLMAVKTNFPEFMDNATDMLLVPDYFHFLLTGEKVTEYTNATTTQLINPKTNDWDFELIKLLGFNEKIFTKILPPKNKIGTLSKAIVDEVGFNCNVVLPATHDTGSAVVTVPYTDDNSLYISSGTWSLMGVENLEAKCDIDSYKLNLTNEGGFDYRYRYLKNIMGLWLIQRVKAELNNEFDFPELCEMAEKSKIKSIIDCNDSRFIAPDSMILEIKSYCKETNQDIPESPAELAKVVYSSLASCYSKTVKEFEKLNKKKYENIYIIGGGAKADYLNKLTKEYSDLNVYAYPIEATALGNLLVQMIYDNVFENIFEAREAVVKTFNGKQY